MCLNIPALVRVDAQGNAALRRPPSSDPDSVELQRALNDWWFSVCGANRDLSSDDARTTAALIGADTTNSNVRLGVELGARLITYLNRRRCSSEDAKSLLALDGTPGRLFLIDRNRDALQVAAISTSARDLMPSLRLTREEKSSSWWATGDVILRHRRLNVDSAGTSKNVTVLRIDQSKYRCGRPAPNVVECNEQYVDRKFSATLAKLFFPPNH